MKIHFLSSETPLTKKYIKHPTHIEKVSYLNAYAVTSHEENVASLPQFLAALTAHADLGHCLVKGELTRPLTYESRAGATDAGAMTSWACFDFDGLPNTYAIDEVLKLMGIGEFSYVLQWSASQGIMDNSLRCHVFMLLARPVAAPVLKQWLIQLNHQTKFLRENLGLTKTNMALSWGLDITACQNDKLIYIAPPILEGIKYPLGRRPRYELIEKPISHLVLPALVNTTETNKLLTAAAVADLRKAANLPARKNTYRILKDTEVLSKPDEATITEIKAERDFVYFNLNGGDSWAYYHPVGQLDIIYNFKGEPNYATRELLPDYYKQTKAAAARHASAESGIGAYMAGAQQPVLLAFRDRATAVYYHGSYDPERDVLDLNVARSEKQLRDFCMQYNMPMGEFVPIWDIVFDPEASFRVDPETRTINMFHRTEYMRNVSKRPVTKCPKTINKIVSHMLAGDHVAIHHLYNWLAFIVQKHQRPRTAWVWYGTEGTGKGMFSSRVLRPLFGFEQTAMRPGFELASQFNLYMKNKILVFFDEAHIAEMRESEQIHGKVRNWITEPTIAIREMRANSIEAPNFAAIVMMSNKANVIHLQKNDRRWNIGPFQPEKLKLTDEEIDEKLPAELQAFYDFLYYFPLDEEAARTPLVSEDRDRLISTTTHAAEDVAYALDQKGANMGFFLDQLPSDGSMVGAGYKLDTTVAEYRKVLQAILIRTRNEGTGRCKISRDELHTLFNYTVGSMPNTPNKFTKFLAHRHIHTEKVRIGDLTVYGIAVAFKDWDRFSDYERDYFPQPSVATQVAQKTKKS